MIAPGDATRSSRPTGGSAMNRTADVVVVGGGVVGASAAYHLAAAGAGRVLVLERADHLAAGSTGACAGGFRYQFSSAINVRLSQASVPMITGFTQEHGLPLDVVQDGYLFLVRGEELWRDFLAANELHASLGVEAEVLTPEEALELAPGIALDGLVGATYGPRDGIADPSGLTQGYATLARRAGAEIELGVAVGGVRTAGGRVRGVDTRDGSDRGGRRRERRGSVGGGPGRDGRREPAAGADPTPRPGHGRVPGRARTTHAGDRRPDELLLPSRGRRGPDGHGRARERASFETTIDEPSSPRGSCRPRSGSSRRSKRRRWSTRGSGCTR